MEALLVFFEDNDEAENNLAAKVKAEQALRASLPTLSRQNLGLAKTRDEINIKEIEDATCANRNTIKVQVKKLAEQHDLMHVSKGCGALQH